GTFGVVYRKSPTHRSTCPAETILSAASRRAGTCHFQRSTGSGESHDPASARTKPALVCLGAAWQNDVTPSQCSSRADSPSESSAGPCVVIPGTRLVFVDS